MVSCDNLGINPYEWLENTLQRIHPNMEEADVVALLPYNYKSQNPAN